MITDDTLGIGAATEVPASREPSQWDRGVEDGKDDRISGHPLSAESLAIHSPLYVAGYRVGYAIDQADTDGTGAA